MAIMPHEPIHGIKGMDKDPEPGQGIRDQSCGDQQRIFSNGFGHPDFCLCFGMQDTCMLKSTQKIKTYSFNLLPLMHQLRC